MNLLASKSICVFLLICFFAISGYAQETERTPFAIEFPELDTGRITSPKLTLPLTNINAVKFWVLNPHAESIVWAKIKVRINRNSASTVCTHNAATQGKVLRCDLNRIAGIGLAAKENLFEIEAVNDSGARFFASFLVITDKKAATLGFSGRRFAVVIGISDYQFNDVGLGNLDYADDDAAALYSWMTQSGGFAPQDILYMRNKDATLSAIRDSLNSFLTKATENDLVLFFLAGHGTPDPNNPSELYYVVNDSKVNDLKNTGFPMTELKRIIDDKMKSKRAIFLLDTCHSAGVSGKSVVGFRPQAAAKGGRNIAQQDIGERKLERPVEVKNDVSAAATRLFAASGRAVLASSDVDETSRESKAWGGGHGVFTWAILEGLRGKADLNADKSITSEELFEYVRQKVRTDTNGNQNPRLLSNVGAGLVVTVLK